MMGTCESGANFFPLPVNGNKFHFLLLSYKCTCSSPPDSNTFTLLKGLTEAVNLSSDLQRNRDMASRVTALLLLGFICVGFASGKRCTCIALAVQEIHTSENIRCMSMVHLIFQFETLKANQILNVNFLLHMQRVYKKKCMTCTMTKGFSFEEETAGDLSQSFVDKSNCLFILSSHSPCTALPDQFVYLPAAQIVVDCCLKVSEKRLPLHILVSYTIQGAGKGCEISATA